MQQILLNQAAFLSTLSHSEGTDRGADPYRVCYGFTHTIVSYAAHPAAWCDGRAPEWIGADGKPGVSIANLGPKYAHSRSTAAGRYQINLPTWDTYQKLLRLPNFSPICQDDCALAIIKDRGALTYVNSGDLEKAFDLLSDTWASLPGSTAGQPVRTYAQLVTTYAAAGGVLA